MLALKEHLESNTVLVEGKKNKRELTNSELRGRRRFRRSNDRFVVHKKLGWVGGYMYVLCVALACKTRHLGLQSHLPYKIDLIPFGC